MPQQNLFEDVARRLFIIQGLMDQAKPSVESALLHARKVSGGDGPVNPEDIRQLVGMSQALHEFSAWAGQRVEEIESWHSR